MALLDTLKNTSAVNRIIELEERTSDISIKGDFTGSVTGTWVRLGDNGEGVVRFNNKEYVTKPIGFISIPGGMEVELSYANGVYYSKF